MPIFPHSDLGIIAARLFERITWIHIECLEEKMSLASNNPLVRGDTFNPRHTTNKDKEMEPIH